MADVMDDEHDEHDDPRSDAALVVGMFVGQFSAGVIRMVSEHGKEGSLAALVDDYIAGRVRLVVNGSGVIDVERASAPPPATDRRTECRLGT